MFSFQTFTFDHGLIAPRNRSVRSEIVSDEGCGVAEMKCLDARLNVAIDLRYAFMVTQMPLFKRHEVPAAERDST